MPADTDLCGGHVFRMVSVHDVFRKLWREKRRFQSAGSTNEGRADQVDAILNFAITAWHMTDWVWKRHENKMRDEFQVNNQKEFSVAMAQCCPELAVCDVLANAAKHGGIAWDTKDRPNVETVLVASSATDLGLALVAHQSAVEWSLKVNIDGNSHDPYDFLNGVFMFWHKFIQKYCVHTTKLSPDI